LAKVIFDDKNKGFKHLLNKENIKLFSCGFQKEIYNNLRKGMDLIKHGTKKDLNKNDIEIIIDMTGNLIRFMILKIK
ncbi:MAG: hypothetical protein PHY10_03670, partial [Patescibacteria group bacterium]|nr:hypothetical protein [Patescibacteria group bacterium]